ncbi:hypothetical protein OPT61_g844 [Boeremia exigua]|uniref:Uncharacterized protein n=1 Tax=Boeremia exigua TaxID=749465 RepID=A0ACC2ISN4_9PLEO|nr:hypothetical protein OPT61_g844 [Boeremia exigua]
MMQPISSVMTLALLAALVSLRSSHIHKPFVTLLAGFSFHDNTAASPPVSPSSWDGLPIFNAVPCVDSSLHYSLVTHSGNAATCSAENSSSIAAWTALTRVPTQYTDTMVPSYGSVYRAMRRGPGRITSGRHRDISWQTLADNVKFMHCNPRNRGITNLYLRKKPNQDKELQYFASGFARALSTYAQVERKKYVASPIPPELDERVIPEEAVRKMARTVLHYKGQLDELHESNFSNALSLYECTPRRFVSDTHPCEGDMFHGLRDCCEQTKTMLIYGEMNSLFHLAAHPEVRFYRLWDEDIYANANGFGLNKLKDSMLQAYICLNIMVLKPELYDPTSRQAFLQAEMNAHRTTSDPNLYDYRLTAAYQRMLLCCTGVPCAPNYCEAHTYPHREFFGIPRGMLLFNHWYARRKQCQPGTVRIGDLAEEEFRGVHLPSKADVEIVLDCFRKKKLPTELALQILDMAEYKPIGRLWIREDPLHVANAEELKKYLSFCWKVLVRINMLVEECGKSLDWESEVADAICTLLGLSKSGRRTEHRTIYDWSGFGSRSEKIVFVARSDPTVQRPKNSDDIYTAGTWI